MNIKPAIIGSINKIGGLILIALLVLISGSSIGAPLLSSPVMSQLSPNQGLSQASVTSMMVDDEGFLWIGTEAGLNRYDGYDIDLVEGADNIIADAPISYLFHDRTHRLWIGTSSQGIFSLSAKSGDLSAELKAPSLFNQNYSQSLNHMLQTDQGELIFALDHQVMMMGEFKQNLRTLFTLSAEQIDAGHIIRKLLVDKEWMYIAVSDGLHVLHMPSGKTTYIPLFANKQVTRDQRNVKELYLDEQGTLWIGTESGLYSSNAQQIQNFTSEPTLSISTQVHINIRNIWKLLKVPGGFYVATDDGLFLLNIAQDSLQHILRLGDSLYHVSDEDITNIEIDRQGNFWFASKKDGAFYWSPESSSFTNFFATQNISSPLSNDSVYAFYEDPDETLWIGTNNGLNRLDAESNVISVFLQSHEGKSLAKEGAIYQVFLSDKQNMLWLVNAHGLQLFDKVSGKTVSVPNMDEQSKSILSGDVYGAKQDKDGNLWFMKNEGFYRLDITSHRVLPLSELNEGLQLKNFACFLGMSPHLPGKMLIAMTGEVWAFDISSRQLTLIHELPDIAKRPKVAADSVVVDRHGVMWLPYSGAGLVGIDVETFEQKYHYSKEKYLGSDIIYGVQLDNDGNLWASSHAGLIKVSVDTQEIQLFTVEHGLKSNEFNSQAYYKLRSGVLVYGSTKGFSLFNPTRIKQAKYIENPLPEVTITRINILSQDVKLPLTRLNGRILDLEHDDVGLSIKFSTLDYSAKRNVLYQYSLKGEQDLVYPPTRSHEVFFPSLAPGNYIFSVTTLESANNPAIEPAYLLINIKYPPWRSPRAYYSFAALLLVVILVVFWIRYRRHLSMLAIHEGVRQSEQRLQLALTSSSSGVWDWKADDNKINQARLRDELGYKEYALPVDLNTLSLLVHPQDRNLYELHWKQFHDQERESLDITYRLKSKDGNWQWYRDLGSAVSKDHLGKVQHAVGTYTNITDTLANEQKARLFGEAFKQTRDWVFILDAKRRPLAVNDAFSQAFSLDPDVESPNQAFLLMTSKTAKWAYYDKIMGGLSLDNHWQEEDIITMPDGTEHAVLVKINAVSDDSSKDNDVAFYVFVMTDINEQKAAETELRHLANYDSLTQLPNRSLLLSRIQHAIDYATRRRSQFAVFFIDLDKFKQINDSLGHDAGDELLTTISQRLVAVTRAEDTVARLGGDEFVLLMENVKDQDVISDLANKILSEVNLPISLKGHTVRVSASIGISVFPQDADSPKEMLKRADIAMYHAKEKNSDRSQFFTQSMNQKAYQRLTMQSRLRNAVDQDEFLNYYQPIVDANKQRTVGFELLMRWRSSEGMISPSEFIPISEDIGLIIPMTWRAIERGLVHLSAWYKRGNTPYLSINLSAKHIEKEFDIERLQALLDMYELPVSALRFELTESALMRDQEQSLKTLNALYDAGFFLSLDDFGTGYSSLKYLREFPLHYIKIDQSFVSDIGSKQSAESIIIATMMMADGLEMSCIAEGIETKEQVAFFAMHNCNLLQGYIFSRPVPFEETLPLLDMDWQNL